MHDICIYIHIDKLFYYYRWLPWCKICLIYGLRCSTMVLIDVHNVATIYSVGLDWRLSSLAST